MAYSEFLADRMRRILAPFEGVIEEKKMMGGLAFMFKGKMSCGIVKDDLMIRIIESKYEDALTEEHTRKMDFTGKSMKGFLYVAAEGIEDDDVLKKWMKCGLEFVEHKLLERAKSKRKKK
jgi:TfoX/Sxy family transcriptional regulator of competence genes